MNAAAPALIASNSASSSSVGEHDDPGRRQLALDPLGRLDAAGAGSDRSIRMMSGEVSRARSIGRPASSASPTTSKSGSRRGCSRSRPEQGVVVDDQDPRSLAVASRSGPPRRRSGPE
jgi:hypothetical protein